MNSYFIFVYFLFLEVFVFIVEEKEIKIILVIFVCDFALIFQLKFEFMQCIRIMERIYRKKRECT